jgi:hypothetical protein
MMKVAASYGESAKTTFPFESVVFEEPSIVTDAPETGTLVNEFTNFSVKL